MQRTPEMNPDWTAEKDPRYYASCRWDMLALVPPGCRTFLDVGCGDGVTGRAIKEKYPGARVVGIEVRPKAAQAAAAVLDRVLCRAVDAALADLQDERFDCLLFGDILEHLVDPWKTLQVAAQLLAPGGAAVASLPNVQHYSVLLNLARGRWTYTARGLLDRTHLRFFTYREAVRLLAGAGLAVERVQPNYRLREQDKARSEWAAALARGLPFLRPYFAFQYVFLARKGAQAG